MKLLQRKNNGEGNHDDTQGAVDDARGAYHCIGI
jgi:hypothetical protein